LRDPPRSAAGAPAAPRERALAALGADPASPGWEELGQTFWPHWRVFRAPDPAHPSRSASVAVDVGGRVVSLTRARALEPAGRAQVCFDALSRAEGVRIDRERLEPYLAFFLRVHLPEHEQFLRGEDDANAVLAHPWQGRHDEYLLAQLEGTSVPVFEVRRTPAGFAATAFAWHPSRGSVHRYELAVDRDGAVRLQETVLGAQRPREGPSSLASAFAVHPEGFLLTAYHAVAEAASITLRFEDGRELAASLERADPVHDLALLRVDEELPAFLALDAREPGPGEPVFTVAFPGPRLLWSPPDAAEGSVRGPGPRPFLFETDVPARAGSSGAPLLDAAGRALGVLTRITAERERWRGTLVVRADEARALLGEAPEPPPPAATRDEARARARAAVCELEVELVDQPGR
jgi:S1-C subfamily serine protease